MQHARSAGVDNREQDVIVVGAGNAATCAALSAREQGASVLMLEVAPEDQRGGNSAFTGAPFASSITAAKIWRG
jgi:succinate dehydrogenase/fumarate reductase flavoprotein subunit